MHLHLLGIFMCLCVCASAHIYICSLAARTQCVCAYVWECKCLVWVWDHCVCTESLHHMSSTCCQVVTGTQAIFISAWGARRPLASPRWDGVRSRRQRRTSHARRHKRTDTRTHTETNTHTQCGREQGGLILQMHCAKTGTRRSDLFCCEWGGGMEGEGEKQGLRDLEGECKKWDSKRKWNKIQRDYSFSGGVGQLNSKSH